MGATQKYYRISHPLVEKAITDFNDGKIDAVDLCTVIYQCHPQKWEHVVRWATESIEVSEWHDVLTVTEADIIKNISFQFIKRNGLLMTPALKNTETGEILAWDCAIEHDSVVHNYGLSRIDQKYQRGFITSKGVFLDRQQAGRFALITRQWFKKDAPLYSRDAEQFSLKDLNKGEHILYYAEIGMSVKKIPVTRRFVELLLKGAEVQRERELKEEEEFGGASEHIIKMLDMNVKFYKDFLNRLF